MNFAESFSRALHTDAIQSARNAGELDGAAGIFDPSEAYGLDETLAYQEGHDATFRPVGGYKIDANGIIVSPGKFQGCKAIVPSLWEQGLEGFASNTLECGYGFCDFTNEAIEPYIGVILTDDENGFVWDRYFTTLDEYQAAIQTEQ